MASTLQKAVNMQPVEQEEIYDGLSITSKRFNDCVLNSYSVRLDSLSMIFCLRRLMIPLKRSLSRCVKNDL